MRIIAAVAWATLRTGVTACPDGLAVQDGARGKTVLPWKDIEGFWFCDQRLDGGVYVLLADQGMELVPLAMSVPPMRPNRHQALTIRDGLSAYLRHVRSDVVVLAYLPTNRREISRRSQTEQK